MGDRGTIATEDRAAIAAEDRHEPDCALLFFLAALPLGVIARIWPGWGLPLSFDETFTATIASQPDFAALLRWCLSELTGPAFYMPMWLWAKVVGTSDLALRIPAVAISIATPLVIARFGHSDRSTRLMWAALMLLWLPAVPMANEARPYPLLLFLVTLQAILFLKLRAQAGAVIAFWWGTATVLAALTNSYALIIGGCQGLALLFVHRSAVLRLWPILVPLIPGAIWSAYHLRYVLKFMAAPLLHYEPDRVGTMLAAPMHLMGVGVGGYALLFLLLVSRREWHERIPSASQPALLIWSGLGAALITLLAAQVGTQRYITPAVPALLFGVASWARHMMGTKAVAVATAYGLLWVVMAVDLIAGPFDPHLEHRRNFEIETASGWLMEHQPNRLHFLWSSPTGWKSDTGSVAEVVGFFFARDGQAIDVIVNPGAVDPNAALARASRGDPDSAILWISDIPISTALSPRIQQIDRRWECRNFGGKRQVIYACRRRSP